LGDETFAKFRGTSLVKRKSSFVPSLLINIAFCKIPGSDAVDKGKYRFTFDSILSVR
jgi:hypothetical protein